MNNANEMKVRFEEELEVIDSVEIEELEQRFEYDTNITICHYEWH